MPLIIHDTLTTGAYTPAYTPAYATHILPLFSREIAAAIKDGSVVPNMTVIDAAMCADPFLIHMAAFQALVNEKRNCVKTRTLHAEVIFQLGANKHVSVTNS